MEIDPTQPPPQVHTLEQARALIAALWLVLGEQTKRLDEQARRIADLEEKLRANSRNSSQPPSQDKPGQDNYPQRRRPSGKKPGGQLGHAGHARALVDEDQVTHFHDCRPAPRCACGGQVAIERLAQRHQVIDVPPVQPVITEYRLYAGCCRVCGQPHEASLPPGVSPRVVGPRLLALIGALTGGYRLSKRMTQGLLADLFGIELSVGVRAD